MDSSGGYPRSPLRHRIVTRGKRFEWLPRLNVEPELREERPQGAPRD
jgi:hypothetical protein